MKKIIVAAFIGTLLGIVAHTSAAAENATEDYGYTREYTKQSVPFTVRPRMRVDKALLDSWIDATKYPTDYMTNPQTDLYVPESFYDY